MSIIPTTWSDRQRLAWRMLREEVRPLVRLLGEGKEGVVFATKEKVYKVYD